MESSKNFELFSLILWSIWFRRNQSRLSPQTFPSEQINQRAFDAWHEFVKAQPGLLAAIRSLDFALEIGIDSVILKGDLEIVINSLREKSTSMLSFSHLIQDAKFTTEAFRNIFFLMLGVKVTLYLIT